MYAVRLCWYLLVSAGLSVGLSCPRCSSDSSAAVVQQPEGKPVVVRRRIRIRGGDGQIQRATSADMVAEGRNFVTTAGWANCFSEQVMSRQLARVEGARRRHGLMHLEARSRHALGIV